MALRWSPFQPLLPCWLALRRHHYLNYQNYLCIALRYPMPRLLLLRLWFRPNLPSRQFQLRPLSHQMHLPNLSDLLLPLSWRLAFYGECAF